MIIGLSVTGFILLVFILIYNSLIGRKNQVENAFSSIDVYLKKRSDLIPSLVGAVKGYMDHEKELLMEITELRSQANAHSEYSNDRIETENKITESIGKVFIAVESYPDLKASENVLMLQRSINEIEAQLSASRRAFNASVTNYNNGVEKFPNSIVASMMSYKRRQVFTLPLAERAQMDQTPEINL
ncbi:MAG: LemA family protein [Crocinitomicaceae bacterium]|nr:LemA family protein [Crocinitomicaceae bacterium]